MRSLHIVNPRTASTGMPQHDEHTATLLAQWAALGSTGLSAEALVLQPWLEGNARFIVSMAKQYPHPTLSQETVVAAAHGAMITLLNRYAQRADKLEKVFVLTLRNAMAAAIHPSMEGP